MDSIDTREWLLSNGLGSYASGTVCDARTRSYHGWLVAALEPPHQRTLLLSHLEASLEIGEKIYALGTNFWTADKVDPWGYQLLQSFTIDPVPTWVWAADGWQLTRRVIMPHGLPNRGVDLRSAPAQPQFTNRVLIQYQYSGDQIGVLRLRPLIGDRNFHELQLKDDDITFSQLVGANQVFLQGLRTGWAGTPWQLRWSHGSYQPKGFWYEKYLYPEEQGRGLKHLEDLYSPGYLTVVMQPTEQVTLEARVGVPTVPLANLNVSAFEQAVQARQNRLEREFLHLPQNSGTKSDIWEMLLKVSDQFIVYQTSLTTPGIIAGYHWFGDRSRDALLCLPGFTFTTKRYALARKLLDRLGRYCYQGLIPNELTVDGENLIFRNIDCSLWWIETLGLYLEETQDWEFLEEQYPVVKQIYKAFTAGTMHGIRIDASDGLITWDDMTIPLTWMDTMVDGIPSTLRNGKPVEVNALWYSTLCWSVEWAVRLSKTEDTTESDRLMNQARRYAQQAEEVRSSMQKFWNAQLGYLYDRITPDDRMESTIRPNAVIALSLSHCAFSEEQGQRVLEIACDRLLTPYGLRTLDPTSPIYRGRCRGTPRQRDLSYHQGTVWSGLLGFFVRAWKRFYREDGKPVPLDLEPLLSHFQEEVCFGGISEIFDGNSPHEPRGAIAQAHPIAELLRHWEDLFGSEGVGD